MSETRITQYAVIGITALVGIGYMVWLSVLYLKFMETDAFLRVTILEHYGKLDGSGESDPSDIVGDGDSPATDIGSSATDNDSLDSDGGPAINRNRRREGANKQSGQGTRRNASPDAP